jgi:hypothetical protein
MDDENKELIANPFVVPKKEEPKVEEIKKPEEEENP